MEVLPNLAALQELIVKTAKWRYREEHGRQRVPKGFTQDLKLKITALEDGSAVPVISFLPAVGAALLLNAQTRVQHYYIEAVDSIHTVLAAAVADTGASGLRKLLPEELLGLFDRVGRGLTAGESLALPNRRGVEALLTPPVRQALIRASGSSTSTEEVTLFGAVPEADQAKERFELHTVDGFVLLNIPFPDLYADAIVDAFAGWRSGARVRVSGVARVDRGGRVVALDSIDEVAAIDLVDIQARFAELSGLPEGWDAEGTAPALDRHALEILDHAFEAYWADDLPNPAIFPSADQGLHIELAVGRRRVELDIDLQTLKGEWFAFDLEDDEDEQEDEFEVGDFEGFERLVASTRHWFGGGR